uniref:Uncharacterized protein n=1 Tax=Salix viminalis TaxID=40686 RepID=A0A6N2MLL1_SALVM
MTPYDFSFVGRHKYSNSATIALVGNDPQGKLYFETQVKSDRKWNNLIANFTGALHDPFAEEAHRKKAEDKILMGKAGQLFFTITTVANSLPSANRDVYFTSFFLKQIVAELTGTYILVFVGCGAALSDEVQRVNMSGIAIVWGAVLMAAIYAHGHFSGAHFNPAGSIALAVARKFSWKQEEVAAEVEMDGRVMKVAVARQNKRPLDFVWEYIITFILMITIGGGATDPRASKDLSGVAIGGAAMFNAMIAGSLGPALVSGVYKSLWVYIVSPILYSVIRAPEPARPEDTNKSTCNNLYLHADP